MSELQKTGLNGVFDQTAQEEKGKPESAKALDYIPEIPKDIEAMMTWRELDVLTRKLAGQGYQEIADGLGIARITASEYMGRVYKKLGVHDSDGFYAAIYPSVYPKQLDKLVAHYGITPMQGKVLGYVLSGFPTPDIAKVMKVSKNTIIDHMKHMYSKMDVQNRAQLFSRAHEFIHNLPPQATQQPAQALSNG
jgi:DNA-binding CsgD family transcriptional regulator